MDNKQILSFTEQMHLAPDLWIVAVGISGAFCTYFLWSWWKMRSKDETDISKLQAKVKKIPECINRIDEKLDRELTGIQRQLNNLEKELGRDYVTYKVFNESINNFKDEIHDNIRGMKDDVRDVKSEIHALRDFLMQQNK